MQSKKILRILNVSEKYKQRPSEVLGIDNTWLALSFDETCEYILSMRKPIYNKDGSFKKWEWEKKPNWNDEPKEDANKIANDFITNMAANLDRQKKLKGIK